MIKNITVTKTDGTTETIAVGQLAEAIAELLTITDSDNLQITSTKSINIEPTKHVKIKPGDGGQIELLPDHTGELGEVLVKAQVSVDSSGNDLAKEKPVRLKINSTELELNTKGADDINPYDIKFKTGVKSSSSGEHYCQTKLKGRSFDIRCYEHGGIALQPCGKDSDNHENKIKFESSRKSPLGTASPQYNSEGGQGLEFGTFNNEHTSLFTNDYRFNKAGKVYAVTRQAPVSDADGKTDYPTQADDFKDVLDNDLSATWEDIVKAAIYLKGQGLI